MKNKTVKITSNEKKIMSVWSAKENTIDRYGKGFHWVESKLVMEEINRRMSGDPNKDWVGYTMEAYLNKKRGSYIGLSLGCGMGVVERTLQKQKICKRLDAYDFAEGAIREAKNLAKEENLHINYSKINLNKSKLKKNTYDFIIANSVLHHIENLEFLFDQMDQSLVENGVIFTNEYVGPSQFQYTNEQVAVINDILNLLPEAYRKRVTDPKSLKPIFIPPTIESMNASDPSEAIRSAEIIDLLKKKFDIIEQRDFGGTLLHMLLQDIVANFNPNDLKDLTVLKLIIYIEHYLIKSGILSSDFSFIIARKKKRNFLSSFLNRFS